MEKERKCRTGEKNQVKNREKTTKSREATKQTNTNKR